MVEVNGFQGKWMIVERTPGSVQEGIDVLVDTVSAIDLDKRRLRDESDELRKRGGAIAGGTRCLVADGRGRPTGLGGNADDADGVGVCG
jgi:hypothetical protein